MKATINPGKRYSSKLNSSMILLFVEESNAICFALHRICIYTKLQIVFTGIFFTYFDHLLKRVQGRSNQKIVIAVSENPHEDVVDPTASPVSPEEGKKIICIETVQYSRKYCPLPDAVLDTEEFRK